MRHRYISVLLCAAIVAGSISPAATAEEYAQEIQLEESIVTEEELDAVIEEEYAEEEIGSALSGETAQDDVETDELIVDLEFTPSTKYLFSGEDEHIAEKEAAEKCVKTLEKLPDPSSVTTNDKDAITAARAEYEALSEYAKNHYIPANDRRKLEQCEDRLAQVESDIAKGRELTRMIGHLPDPAEITLDDEPEVEKVEAVRDSYTDDELAQTNPEALAKLVACRDKLTQLKALEDVQNYVDNELKPVVDKGEYDEEHQKEIDEIIKNLEDKIRELTENGNPDGSPVTQEQIDELINQAKEEISKVKTVHQIAAAAYEEKLKQYKSPEELTLADEEDVEKLREDYDALSSKAKEILDTEYIAVGESFKSRLDNLEKKINKLREELVKAKKEAKDYYHKNAKITPEYYTESGIEESYNGIDGMASSGNYTTEGMASLDAIEDEYDAKIDDPELIDIEKINQYRDEAVSVAVKVRDSERLKADEYEAKIDAMGPVIDLSRGKAEEVRQLRKEYEALPSYAKKYVDTNKTSAGDTYKERLEALEKRIDQMAQEDASAWEKLIEALPSPDEATLGDEGNVRNARIEYDALTPEAKAKVKEDALKKLEALEAKMVLEHQKEDILFDFNNWLKDKLATTTYEQPQLNEVNAVANEGRSAIKSADSYEDALKAKEDAIKKIEAIKTKAQLLKEKGIKTSFSKMRFRTVKQTASAIWFRWAGVKGIDGFQIYGAKKGGKMKLVRQYDYKARSSKITKLYEKTEYKYKIYAFKIVDGEIIKVYASPLIYATTKGGKYGTVKSVSITNVGKKDTSKEIRTVKITLKKGKKAKILKKEYITGNLKLKRRRAVKFESTNRKVATVSSGGVIKAKGNGTCLIRAYSQSGKFRTILVKVK
ncbi:MAG: hypothetical protein IJ245_09660 [Lachnospiraceae bacterium]|nr:hypothetical protein [Lachnospiraceae bacterium]